MLRFILQRLLLAIPTLLAISFLVFGAASLAPGDPVDVLAGEKASGTFLIDQTKLVANNVSGTVVKGSGHWLIEEAPDQVIPALVTLLNNE